MSTSRITTTVLRALSTDLIHDLADIGIDTLTVTPGRSPFLEEKRGLFFRGKGVVDDPVEIIAFMVPSEVEDQVVSYIISKAHLEHHGRGSIYAEDVEVLHDGGTHCINSVQVKGLPVMATLREVTGICCIVQRGHGEAIARIALDVGAGVPSLTFGTGLGVRDKMGLLRITIPAEKELVWIATSNLDTDIVFNAMIDTGRLDQPGKGFIYTFPLKQGYLNVQVTRNEKHPAASIEQIVSAIDGIKEGIEWRRHIDPGEMDVERAFLTGLVDFTLMCDEGGGDELVAVAMAAGAAGASLAKARQISPCAGIDKVSKARECCYMIVGEAVVPKIFEALEDVGTFTDKYHGQVIIRKTHRGFTYLPPNAN